jgi:hypothetical protein
LAGIICLSDLLSRFYVTHTVVTRAFEAQRDQFGTALEPYINAFKSRVRNLNRVANATHILPRVACSMLLKALEPEFLAWAKINQKLLAPVASKAKEMQESEFLKLCSEAIGEARSRDNNAMYAQNLKVKNRIILHRCQIRQRK